MISNTRVIAPVPSRNWPYRPAIVPRLAPIATPYSRNPVSVPIPSVAVDDLVARVPEQPGDGAEPEEPHQRPERRPPQGEARAGRDDGPQVRVVALELPFLADVALDDADPRQRLLGGRRAARRSCPGPAVLTRWSGRPKTTATAISAGASSRTMNSSVGLSVNRMMTEPTSPMTDDSRLVTVWVSIVRTSVTSLERRDTSSPTRLAGVEVERQRHEPAEQVAAQLGDDPLPHHAEQVRLQEAADGLDQNRASSMTTGDRARPRRRPPRPAVVIPAMTSGNASPTADEMTRPTSAMRERPAVAGGGSGTGGPTARRRSRAPRGRRRPASVGTRANCWVMTR